MATVERIEGAGAALWQATTDGDVTIAIIHRPRYDDWSLPKGGVDAGESHIQAAFREVLEETGVKAIFGPEIGTVDYEVNGVTKEVRYWLAEADQFNAATPNPEEVDAIEWVSISDAINKLSNSDDREIVRMAEEFGFGSTPLVLLRHTKALERGDWDEVDSERTLNEVGFDQAQLLIKHLEPFAIDEVYTSNYTRCVQTVTPLSHSRGLAMTQVPSLNEETFENDPQRAVAFANALKQDEKNILICSHNPVIPTMLRGILNTKLKNKDLIKLEPGDAWIVHRVQGEIVGLDYLSIKN